MVRRLLVLTVGLLAVGAAAAGAQGPPSWNSGYNGWWPSGYGYPPVTVHAHGYPCSGAWTQDYGGGTSCSGGVGTKPLTIYDGAMGPLRAHTVDALVGEMLFRVVVQRSRGLLDVRVVARAGL